jgi:hypothetical protein
MKVTYRLSLINFSAVTSSALSSVLLLFIAYIKNIYTWELTLK